MTGVDYAFWPTQVYNFCQIFIHLLCINFSRKCATHPRAQLFYGIYIYLQLGIIIHKLRSFYQKKLAVQKGFGENDFYFRRTSIIKL